MKKNVKNPLSLLLSLLMIFSTFLPVFGEAATSNDYSSHWAKATIQTAIASGLASGYPDGSFKPENNITRAEFFSLVNNAYKYSSMSQGAYTDVAVNAWYAPVISSARAAGYISGYPDGSIHPEMNISRQEVALIISRIQSLNATSATPYFSDMAVISDWSKQAVAAVFQAKIMSGYPDGSFKPQASITRAEALVAVNNSLHIITVVTRTGIRGFDAIADVQAGSTERPTYATATDVEKVLPKTATGNMSTVTVPVTLWTDTDTYNPKVAGSYTFTATLGAVPNGYENISPLSPMVEVVVAE